MSKRISRRDFLRGSAAGALGFFASAAVGHPVFAEEAGTYTPGTYSAIAQGIESSVTVTATFDAESIVDVQIDVSGETPGLGADIGEQLRIQIRGQRVGDIRAVGHGGQTGDAQRRGRTREGQPSPRSHPGCQGNGSSHGECSRLDVHKHASSNGRARFHDFIIMKRAPLFNDNYVKIYRKMRLFVNIYSPHAAAPAGEAPVGVRPSKMTFERRFHSIGAKTVVQTGELC